MEEDREKSIYLYKNNYQRLLLAMMNKKLNTY